MKIENKDGDCPLGLEFGYSIFFNEEMMNRDRTEVNHHQVLNAISSTIFQEATEDFAREFVAKDMDSRIHRNSPKEDLQRGPYFLSSWEEQVKIWKKVIRELHQVSCDENLVVASHDTETNNATFYKGYTLLQFPEGWKGDLLYLGYEAARDKLEKKIIKKGIQEENLSTERLENMRMAKLKLRKAFHFSSIKDFPNIQVAEELKVPNSEVLIEGLCCNEDEEILLNHKILDDFPQTLKILLHELVHWRYKVEETSRSSLKLTRISSMGF